MGAILPEMEVYAGENTTWTLTITDPDGTATDLTGSSIHFTVKNDLSDRDAKAEINVETTSHTDAANGLTTIAIDLSSVSDKIMSLGASWMGDIWLKDSVGNKIPQGLIKVKVNPSATRTF